MYVYTGQIANFPVYNMKYRETSKGKLASAIVVIIKMRCTGSMYDSLQNEEYS